MSLYDTIRNADDIAEELVEVPEWPGKDGKPSVLSLRSPTSRERAQMLNALTDEEGDRRETLFALVLSLTAHDPADGARLFTQSDVEWLSSERNGKVMQRVATVGMRLAGLVEDAVEQGKDDSSETPTDGTDSA